MKKANGKSVNAKQNNKNNSKKKKEDIKSVIDSPFSLGWPSIDFGRYSQVVSCLKQSFYDYITVIKEQDGSEVSTEPKVPKDIKNNTKKLLSKSNPTHIIFGYNAVMRGLEKGNIKAVLVNADTSPNMLIKSFIPVCNLQSIPLIPVKNLSDVFSNEVSIRSTLAVGFTSTACEEKGPFHNLYVKCCNALGYDNCREDPNTKEISNPIESPNRVSASRKQTEKLISSYHLKRENRNTRAFQPPAIQPLKRESQFDMFIKLDKSGPLEAANIGTTINNKRKVTAINNLASSHEPPPLSFFIDVDNHIEIEELEEEKVQDKHFRKKPSAARYFDALGNSPYENDTERKANYIPAKIKRVKGNVKRQGKLSS